MSWRDDKIVSYAPQAARGGGRSSWRDDEIVGGQPGQPEYTEEEYKQSESYRQSELRANEEMLLAQAHKSLADSNWPSAKSLMVGLGSSTMSKIHRGLGNVEKADQYSRFGGAIEQAQVEREKGGIIPDFLQRNVRGIFRSLSTALPAGFVGGAPAIIAMFTGDQANESYTEGKDAGLRGKELAQHVTTMALIEGGVTGAFSLAGAGGFEKVAGGLLRPAAKEAGKGAVKGLSGSEAKRVAGKLIEDVGYEAIEELITAGGQIGEGIRSGVSPNPDIGQALGDAAFQAVGGTVAVSAPGFVAARKSDKQEKARAEILEAAESDRAPSVRQWKSWGIDQKLGRSRAERTEGVREMAEEIRAAEAATPPTSQPSMAAGAAAELETAPQGPQEAAGASPQVEPADRAVQPPVAPEGIMGAPPDATSIANAAVAEQRAQRGEETVLPTSEPETFEQWLDTAQNEIAKTPSLPGRLVAELNKKPRTLSDVDTAVLQVQYRTLTDELSAASETLTKAQDGGRKTVIGEAQEKANEVLRELVAIEEASKKSGTEAGRSLVARKMAIRRDYTLGSVVMRLTVAKGGEELTKGKDGEMAAAKKYSKEALALEAKQAALAESIQAQDSEAAVVQFIKKSTPKKRFSKLSAERTAAAKEQVRVAMADFKAKLARKKPDGGVGKFVAEESGAVDLELVESGASLVKAYADLGVATFAEFFANVKSQLGDVAGVAKDSLRVAWTNAQEAGLIPKPDIDPTDTRGMSKFAKKVARSVVESGVTARDEVVGAVHEELQAISPDITRRQAMDAISGYGIYSELSKGEASATLRDLSGQLRQLAKLEDIQGGQPPKKTGVEHRTQSEEELQLVQQVKEAMRESGLDAVDDAAKTATYKEMLTKKITDLERRIAESDFSKPARRKTVLDEEATALKYKAKVVKGRLDAMEERFRNSQLKGFKRLYRYMGESSNLGRAMKTAFDLSGLLRQGKYAVAANPKMAKKSIVSMVRAYWSKELAFNDAEAIRNNPYAQQAAQAGLAITEPEGKLTEQEEVFRGEWAKYIPGVAGAERAYAAGLNSLRMDYFSQLMDDMEAGGIGREAGKATDAEAKAIANVVNVFTGRGSYRGQNQAAAQFLSTYFFSPRFVMSRFQLLAGQPLVQGSMRTRKLIAREYGRSMGSMATIYSLAAIAGYFALSDEDKPKFEWNPQSTEFAKIRFGDIVLDPAAGMAQVVTFTSRVAPDFMGGGMTKSSTGEIVPIRGPDVPFSGTSVMDVWVRFFQSKLAPLPAAILNANVGENVIGEETDIVHELLTLPIPLSFGDVYDALQADGYSTKAALATLALFGDGVNRYQNANPARFAKKIALHPELEGVSKTTGEEFSYTEAVEQMVAEAKKRGITLDQLIQALDEEMRAAGKSAKSIRGKKKLLRRRFQGR